MLEGVHCQDGQDTETQSEAAQHGISGGEYGPDGSGADSPQMTLINCNDERCPLPSISTTARDVH